MAYAALRKPEERKKPAVQIGDRRILGKRIGILSSESPSHRNETGLIVKAKRGITIHNILAMRECGKEDLETLRRLRDGLVVFYHTQGTALDRIVCHPPFQVIKNDGSVEMVNTASVAIDWCVYELDRRIKAIEINP